MARQKQKSAYRPDYYASSGEQNDYFGTVYESLYQSVAFLSLPTSVKHFYTLCRIQLRSNDARRCLYNYCNENNKIYTADCGYFVFTASQMERYGYQRQNGNTYLKKLAEEGFIQVVERNQHRHRPNIYRFSNDWRTEKDK